LSARPHSAFSQTFSTIVGLAILLPLVVSLAGQNPATSLTVLSRDGRRSIATVVVGTQEIVLLDDLAAAFQLTVREEGGAITVSYKGRIVVLTPDQTLASVAGRLISLSAAPTRVGGRWAVPLDFISRALAPVYDTRLDLRRPSRLLVVGDLRVPRVSVRHEALGNAARVTIDATPAAASTVTQDGNQRLAIKFDADALDVAFPAFQPQGFVQAMRLVDPVTIAIELGPRFGAFRAATQPLDAASRLVVGIVGADLPPPTTTTNEPPPDLPQFGAPASAIRTLAIDAGHGGDDTGAKGANGTVEKDVTLSIARRLRAAVEARLGIRVVMTRDDDRAVPVIERTAVANNSKADLFISLHANASFRNTVAGAAVYVASFDDAPGAGEVLTPERLPVFGGGLRDIELVPWNLAQIRYRDRSEQAATIFANQFSGRVPLAARPVDRAPLRVLESANMPAVLIEVGYLSNADQEKRLTGAEFQGALVQSVLDGLIKFRDALGDGGGAQ
jgi:N-acetylmuramoyl-L-alanine amidase